MENDMLYIGPDNTPNEEETLLKKDKNKLNIEISNEELKKLEEMTSQIYMDLKSKKEISLYTIKYLLLKLDLIQVKITDILHSNNFSDIKDKQQRILSKIILVMCLGIPLNILLTPYLSILVSLLMIVFDLKFIYDSKDLTKRFNENSKEYFSRLTSINENVLYSELILKEKVEEIEKKAKASKKAQKEDKFLIANNIIVDLVNKRKSEYIDENLSQEVCDIIRKILQDDLNTEETNLSILIDMAREKTSINTLQDEIGLRRRVLSRN